MTAGALEHVGTAAVQAWHHGAWRRDGVVMRSGSATWVDGAGMCRGQSAWACADTVVELGHGGTMGVQGVRQAVEAWLGLYAAMSARVGTGDADVKRKN